MYRCIARALHVYTAHAVAMTVKRTLLCSAHHALQESACSVAPQELRAVSCAPLDSDQVASISNSGDCDRNGNSGQEGPAVGESEGDGSGEGKGLAGVAPPRHLVSVTVSWNAAAQRVLGRWVVAAVCHGGCLPVVKKR